MPNTSAKKEITQEKFSCFLAWLNPDIDRAVEEYERLQFMLGTFFSRRGCVFADELVDETINRVILKSSEEQIECVTAFVYGVAKNVYRESLRKQRLHLDIQDVQVAAPQPERPSFSRECLDKCLEELVPKDRDLLLDYFLEAKSAKIKLRRSLSENRNTTQTAVRMKIVRLKGKLKSCVTECMS